MPGPPFSADTQKELNNLPGFPSADVFVLGDYLQGQLSLTAELVATTSLAVRYLAVTGDDVRGDGSLTKPWRQPQRAIDAIQNRACLGIYEVRCLDAGPYQGGIDAQTLLAKNGQPFGLIVKFVGAGTSIKDFTPVPAAASVANPTGGNKQSLKDYNIGAFVGVADGTHWLRLKTTVGSETKSDGYVVDGVGSASPNLRVAYSANLGAFGYTGGGSLIPYTTVWDDGGIYVSLNGPLNSSVAIELIGLIVGSTNVGFKTLGSVSMKGCKTVTTTIGSFMGTGPVDGNLAPFLNILCAFQLTIASANRAQLIGGIHKGQLIVNNAQSFVVSAVIRTTVTPQVEISSSTYKPKVAALFQSVDFEGTGTQTGFSIRSQSMMDLQGISVDGLARFCDVTDLSIVKDTSGIFGSVAGNCLVLTNGSQCFGFVAEGGATRLRNSVTPGNDIVVGGNAVVAFAALPTTDVGAAAPQFCRST